MPVPTPSELILILEIAGNTYASSLINPVPTSGSVSVESPVISLNVDDLIDLRVRITAGSIGFSLTEGNSIMYCTHAGTKLPSTLYL